MKNISLFLNIILLIAVGVLFYFHFTAPKIQAEVKKQVAASMDTTPKMSFTIPKNLAGARILYINIDSLNAKYDAIRELTQETEQRYKYLQQSYQQKAQELQQREADYEQNAKAGLYTPEQGKKIEDGINRGADSLQRMEAEMNNFQDNAMKKNSLIIDQVTKYFKNYSKDKGVDFILGYGSSSNVLYANDSLDVTNDVLNALNANYRKGKK